MRYEDIAFWKMLGWEFLSLASFAVLVAGLGFFVVGAQWLVRRRRFTHERTDDDEFLYPERKR
jgi:hypothetical protein